ncbi:MAG: HdeD family acid-resistance protein [Acutalibacteraceae bacterium]
MKITFKISRIVMSLCEATVGILLLVNPVGFTTGIITFAGVVLTIMGIASIVQYFRLPPVKAAAEKGLMRGLIVAASGIFCIVKSDWFIAVFPLITVIYGVGTLIMGIVKIQWTADMLRLKAEKWYWAAISAALSLICAIIILCNPFSGTKALWIFIAVALIVEAAVDIIVTAFVKTEDNMIFEAVCNL